MGFFSRAAALLTLAWISILPVRAETLESIKLAVRRKFPSVRQMSPQDLSLWLADTNRPQPILIDVRGPEEFAVSHLRDAVNLRSVPEVRQLVQGQDRPLVLYCSVGYRSSDLAEKLQRAGVTNAFNLEGSIFAWANEGRPLHRGQRPVTEVHGYSRKWSRMVKPGVVVRY